MSVDVTVDLALYPIEAVMGTAYVFVDRCYVFLDKPAEDRVRVSLTGKPGTTDDDLRTIGGEFQNELLSQALRLEIGKRHERVRELLMARALFGAAPKLEPEGGQDDLGPDELDELEGLTDDRPEDAGTRRGEDGPRRWRAVGRAEGEGDVTEPPRDGGPDQKPDLLADDGDDYLDDPLGIAVPWEEKFAKPAEAAGGAGSAAPSDADGPAAPVSSTSEGGSGAGRE